MIQVTRIGFGLFAIALLGASVAFSATPGHKAVQYGDQALAFSAGFIREEVPADGVVAKTSYNRQILGRGDTVYLKMKYPEEVAAGALYTVYRRSRKVFHPSDGQYVGSLISIVGVVQITKIDKDLATAKVDRSYMWTAPGDFIMPFSPPSAEETAISEPSLADTLGMIIEVQTPRTLVAQTNIVYLDLGRVDGIHIGDSLEVLRARRGFPTEAIGEVKVLNAEETTATALIVQAMMPLAIGDQVVPKESTKETAIQGSHAVTIETSPMSASTKTRESLRKSLRAEIAKGDVTVEQIGDKVTISLKDLVEQLEYESGKAQINPAGMSILKQIGTYLLQDTEQEILVEGHTDDQPIGPSLIKYYPTNQELSEARASLIVRYFIDAGISPTALTAIGYADSRPVASNAVEQSRKRNRRIEIVLTPKHAEAPHEERVSTRLDAIKREPAELPAADASAPAVEPSEPLHVNVPMPPDTASDYPAPSLEVPPPLLN